MSRGGSVQGCCSEGSRGTEAKLSGGRGRNAACAMATIRLHSLQIPTKAPLLASTHLPPTCPSAFWSPFNDLPLPNNALNLHVMPFGAAYHLAMSPFQLPLRPSHATPCPLPPLLTYPVLETWSTPVEATCHMGLWALKMWLVWTDMCCKCKIHTGFRR